jgi:hypothetical protein
MEGGYAFIWANDSTTTVQCAGFAYNWPEDYGNVFWNVIEVGNYPASLTDASTY